MSFTHTIGLLYTTNGQSVTSANLTQTGNEEFDIDAAIPPATVNFEYDVAFTLSTVRSILLTCDQAITIKTNSSGSPQETITLTAGQAIVWQTGATLGAGPFAASITKFFLSNAGTATANFKARILAQQ
jgi:hypothetical protein